jgi:hypothetical protein
MPPKRRQILIALIALALVYTLLPSSSLSSSNLTPSPEDAPSDLRQTFVPSSPPRNRPPLNPIPNKNDRSPLRPLKRPKTDNARTPSPATYLSTFLPSSRLPSSIKGYNVFTNLYLLNGRLIFAPSSLDDDSFERFELADVVTLEGSLEVIEPVAVEEWWEDTSGRGGGKTVEVFKGDTVSTGRRSLVSKPKDDRRRAEKGSSSSCSSSFSFSLLASVAGIQRPVRRGRLPRLSRVRTTLTSLFPCPRRSRTQLILLRVPLACWRPWPFPPPSNFASEAFLGGLKALSRAPPSSLPPSLSPSSRTLSSSTDVTDIDIQRIAFPHAGDDPFPLGWKDERSQSENSCPSSSSLIRAAESKERMRATRVRERRGRTSKRERAKRCRESWQG